MRTYSWLSILALLGAANHAAAADGDTYARVCVSNTEGIRANLTRAGEQQPRDLDGHDAYSYNVSISGREALEIKFCEQNPLLFTYSVGELTTTPREAIAGRDLIVGAINSIGATFSGAQLFQLTESDARGVLRTKTISCVKPVVASVNGINLTELREYVESLLSTYNSIPAAIDASRQPRSDLLKQKRDELGAALDELTTGRALIASLHRYAATLMPGRPISFELADGRRFGSFEAFEESINSEECGASHVREVQSTLGHLNFVVDSRDDLADMLKTLETFSAALQDVGGDRTAVTLSFDATSQRAQKLNIAANSTFEEFYSDATKKFVGEPKRLGTPTINVEPQLNFRLKIAPGVIYSFVKQPKFSAEENDSGGFTVRQTESNYTAANGIVAVNITREKYMHENVRPFVQIGLSPKKDELAFVLGAGIALDDSNNTVLSFGAIYQERKKLAPGLSVGGTLASADDLKTDTEFKVGFYVGVSYNMLPTK